MNVLARLNQRLDVSAILAGALFVGLLATGACGGATPPPVHQGVIGTALCERYDQAGKVTQSGDVCPPLATPTRAP